MTSITEDDHAAADPEGLCKHTRLLAGKRVMPLQACDG